MSIKTLTTPAEKTPHVKLLPKHVAIIMDGNGRWANQKRLPRIEGHRQGTQAIRDVIRAAIDLKIPFLTLYAFSKENWARPREEVTFLMSLLSTYLDAELKEMQKNKIRFQIIGRLDELPVEIQRKIKRNIESTKDNKALTLSLALSYSGRDEIVQAARLLAEKVKRGELNSSEINEYVFSQNLFTRGMPDPDLLIRTSGELRISNFLLWQLSYTEIYVTEKLWPDFRKDDLKAAVDAYMIRERRFGNIQHEAGEASGDREL